MIATLMWNHAPTMWDAMRRNGTTVPGLSEDQARELFGFFYTARYFDLPGDAGRGKRIFDESRCSACHQISGSERGSAASVILWRSLGDPILLARQMWNHAWVEGRSPKRKPTLTSQDLTDILVYARNLPAMRGRPAAYSLLLTQSNGPAPVAAGCGHSQCHSDRNTLESRIRSLTLTDLAVVMWNHKPQTVQVRPALDEGDMEQFVTEVWANQFFGESGSAARGKRIFVRKNCVACHVDASGVVRFPARNSLHSTISMAAGLWQHGPQMMEEMRRRNLRWPRFSTGQFADLIAYLNSLTADKIANPAVLRASIRVSPEPQSVADSAY